MTCSHVRHVSAGLLALVAVIAGADHAAAQTTLRYKFTKGEKLNYLIEQKINTTTTGGGREFNTDMVQTIDMVWNITDVDANGKARMTQTFGRIRFTMNGRLGKVEYDSKQDKEPEGPEAKAIIPILRVLAGSEIGLSMDPLGRITDLKLPEKLIAAAKSLPAAAGP